MHVDPLEVVLVAVASSASLEVVALAERVEPHTFRGGAWAASWARHRPRAVQSTGPGNVAALGGLVPLEVVGVGLVVLEHAQAQVVGLGAGEVVAELERLGELHLSCGVAASPRWWWSPSASSTGEPRPPGGAQHGEPRACSR